MIEQLDQIEIPTRLIDKPFRLSVVDTFKGGAGGSNSTTVSGRIESGAIQIGEHVQILPLTEYAVIKTIEVNLCSVKWAASGDSVSIGLTGIEPSHIRFIYNLHY